MPIKEINLYQRNITGPDPSVLSIEYVHWKVQSVLRQTVDQSGWSDTEIARKAGLPQSTVYRLLNAKTAKPSFGAVYRLCNTLGIPLPFDDLNKPEIKKSPISIFIGKTSDEIIRQGQSTEYIQVPYELRDFAIGKVVDDCAELCFSKGSLLFFDPIKENNLVLRCNDVVLVRVGFNKRQFFLPLKVLQSPEPNEWILHHLTNNKAMQFIIKIDCQSRFLQKKGYSFHIIGLVHKALISLQN